MARLNVSGWDTGLLSSLKASDNLDPKASEEAVKYANAFGISPSQAMQEVSKVKSTWGKGDDNGLIDLPKTSPQVAELMKDPIMANLYRNSPSTALRWAKGAESEWVPVKMAKSVLNGVTGVMGAFTGAAGGALEVVGNALDNDRIYNAGRRAVSTANEWAGMRFDVQADSTAGRIGYAFLENAPQFLAQAFVGSFNPAAGAAMMAAQVGGGQYAELRRNNISVTDSALASSGNAAIQGAFETFSLGKVLNAGRRLSQGTNAGKAIAEAMLTEGVTEFIQEYPDAAAEIWAKYNHFSTEDQVNRFVADFNEITERGAYAGAVGALYGLLGSSVSVAANRQVQAQKSSFVATMAEQAQASGVTPDMAKVAVDTITEGEVVYLDAETVQRVFNQQGIDPLLTLGVSESQINQAVENGSDIIVSAGSLTKAKMEMRGLLEELKGNYAFGSGEAMESRVKESRALEAAFYQANKQTEQADAVFGDFRQQLEAAGVKGKKVDDIITVLRSRGAAYNPENPAQYYIDHPLEIARDLYMQAGQYAQTKTAGEKLLEDEKHFGDNIDKFISGKLVDKTIRVMQTPLALEVAGAKILPVDISVENLDKVLNGKHKSDMSADIVKQIPRALTDPLMIFDTYDGKNGAKRKIVALDLKSENGATIVVPFELEVDNKSNKYVMNEIISAYGKTDNKTGEPRYEWFAKQIENGKLRYINKEKTAKLIENEKPEWLMPFSTDSGFLSANIPNETDLVKRREEMQGYYQSAFHGSPHKFEKFDLGAIGTGTGIQAHGWGLYFAFSKNTAKRYRDRLKGRRDTYTDEGSLVEVDIPENDVLLDEDKAIEKQPPKVRAIIEAELERIGGSANNGKSFYRELIFEMRRRGMENPARAASEHLNKLGIKGIKYVGMVDGQSYVIFDDQAVKIINSYNQKVNNDKKGAITWDAEGKAIISLFEGSDPSTVIHETVGHYFVENLMQDGVMATATEQMRKDRQTMLEFAGITEQEWQELNKPNGELSNKQFARKTEIHEKWAQAAERYFLEGKAPSAELRGVMRRFKKWLLEVYSSLRGNMLVEINDDVRQVFDRMLASEEMIAEETRIDGYFAAMPDSIKGNVSDAQRRNLATLMSNAKGMAADKLSKEMLVNFTQAQKEKIAARKKVLRKEAELQVKELPVYNAAEMLKEEMKHNAKYLAKNYIEETLTKEQISMFELIAGLNDYTNGQKMAEEILKAPTYKTAVNEAINDAIKAEFPDLASDRAAAMQAAKEAMYNEQSGLLIATEAEIIQGRVDKIVAEKYARMRLDTAKVQARSDLHERYKINEAVKTTKYITAERTAALKEQKARRDGDMSAAARYKNIQLYNHACVIESLKIRNEVAAAKRYLSKIAKAKPDSWKNEQHLAQAGALLARFGLSAKGYNPEVKTKTLAEYILETNDKYDNMDIAGWLINEDVQVKNPGKELTIEQLQDLVDAIKNIKKVASDENKLKVLTAKGDFNEVKSELLGALGKLPTKQKIEIGSAKETSVADRFKASILTPEMLFEKYDGWKQGVLSRLFGTPARRHDDALNVMQAEYSNAIKDSREEWLPSRKDKSKAFEKKERTELGGGMFSDMELVQMLCNLGNKEGIEKICAVGTEQRPTVQSMYFRNSSLWVTDNIEATRENLLSYLGQELGAGGIKYAQAKINAAGQQKDIKFDLDRRTTGFTPVAVETVGAVIETPQGTVTFSGGYFPLVRDRGAGSKPQGQDAIADNKNPGGRIRTNRGSSKARTKAIYPIDLSPDCEMQAVMDTLHDIAYRELFSDINKIFNDGEIYRALVEKLGNADFAALREYYLAKTNDTKSAKIGEGLMSDTASWLRRKTSSFVIMMNVKVNLQNLGNIFLYGNSVEGWTHTDTVAAIMNWSANLQEVGKFGGLIEGVQELSPYMRFRADSPDYTINELRSEGKQSELERKFMDAGAKLMSLTDGLTAYPVWAGAYAKKIREGSSHLEARDFADTVIRRTLGAFDASNTAPILRVGGGYKLLTMFQSFFVTQANQWIREYGIFMRDKDVVRLANFALSKWLIFSMVNLMLSGEDPFEEDEGLGNKLFNELVTYPASMWGPVGTAANVALSNALGIKNYGYRLSAAQSTIEKTLATVGNVRKAAEGKRSGEELAEDLTYLTALYGGVPKGIHTLFWNSYDYIANDMDLKLGDIYRRRPKRERDE